MAGEVVGLGFRTGDEVNETVEEIILLTLGLGFAELAAYNFVHGWYYNGAWFLFAALWWLRYHGPSK